MRLEYLEFSDGESQLTVVFESKQDMLRFKESTYDNYIALLPDKPCPQPSESGEPK